MFGSLFLWRQCYSAKNLSVSGCANRLELTEPVSGWNCGGFERVDHPHQFVWVSTSIPACTDRGGDSVKFNHAAAYNDTGKRSGSEAIIFIGLQALRIGKNDWSRLSASAD
jgi:hypothetical protein